MSGGIAGYTTTLIFDRLAAFGRPATVAEIVDAVIAGPGVPWAGIGQRYQQALCSKAKAGTLNRFSVPAEGEHFGFDPVLGWRYPDYDPADPEWRKKAVKDVVRKTLRNHSTTRNLNGRVIRRWAVKHSNDRWSINPDESQHPRVRTADGTTATYDSGIRAEIDAGKAAQVAVVNRNADRQAFERMSPAEQATVLRWLTDRLDIDRHAASRVSKSILADWKRRGGFDHDAALAKLRDLLEDRRP